MKSIVRTAIIASAFFTCISAFASEKPQTAMDKVEELLNDSDTFENSPSGKIEVRTDSRDEEYSGAWTEEYPTLSSAMRDFWAGVGEPENGQGIKWLQQFFSDVNSHTFAHFDITKAYQPIPFEKLSAKEAVLTADAEMKDKLTELATKEPRQQAALRLAADFFTQYRATAQFPVPAQLLLNLRNLSPAQ